MELKGIVLCGTVRQFQQWLIDNKQEPTSWVYGSERIRVLGIHKKKIVLTGEYWKNPVYNSEEFAFLRLDNEVIDGRDFHESSRKSSSPDVRETGRRAKAKRTAARRNAKN
jgi:hypothetical protein